MNRRSLRTRHYPVDMDKHYYSPLKLRHPIQPYEDHVSFYPQSYKSSDRHHEPVYAMHQDHVSFQPISYKGGEHSRIETPQPTVAERALSYGRWSENPLKMALSYHDKDGYPPSYFPRETELDQLKDKLTGKRRIIKRSTIRRRYKRRSYSRK